VDYEQRVKFESTTIKTSWLARTVTSSEDIWIGAYSFGLTIPGKLGYPLLFVYLLTFVPIPIPIIAVINVATISITALIILAFSIMTLSINGVFATLSINNTQRK
jgi:hypothetical protein